MYETNVAGVTGKTNRFWISPDKNDLTTQAALLFNSYQSATASV